MRRGTSVCLSVCYTVVYVCRAAMRRGTAALLVAAMFVCYTLLFAWRANLDLSNQLLLGVVSPFSPHC